MAEKETILHTRLRFKPEGSDQYVVALVETSATDVLVDTPFSDIYNGKGTLKDLLAAIEEHMVRPAIVKTSLEFTNSNPILGKGQLGIEYDTGIIKVGDGVSVYNNLKFALKTESSKIENLDFNGFNVVDENNEVVDVIDEEDHVQSASIDTTNKDGNYIQINANDLSIGSEESHNTSIWFEIKDPLNSL